MRPFSFDGQSDTRILALNGSAPEALEAKLARASQRFSFARHAAHCGPREWPDSAESGIGEI